MGDDVIQGDGSVTLNVGTYANPGTTVADFAGAGSDGMDYIEGGGGNDLIFGGLGQDDIIGGSSDLFGYTTPAQRPDGVDKIFGGTGAAIGLNDPGDTSANGHSHDADVILGDNGDIYRLVGSNGQFLTYNYDNYAGETEHIVPRAVKLLDYSPYGDSAYTTCDPNDPDELLDDDERASDEHRRRRLPPRRGRQRRHLRRDRRRHDLRRRPGRPALRQLRQRLDLRRHRRRRRSSATTACSRRRATGSRSRSSASRRRRSSSSAPATRTATTWSRRSTSPAG